MALPVQDQLKYWGIATALTVLALWFLGQTIAAGQIVGMVVVGIAMSAHSRYRAQRERDEPKQ